MRRMIAAGPASKRPPHSVLAGTARPGRGRLSTLFATAFATFLVLLSAEAAADSTKIGQFIPVAPPQPAPAAAFTDAAGNRVSLRDFVGRPTVVNLWATWCAPCLKEMPSLDRLQAKLTGRLQVAAIAEDHGGGKVVAPFVAKRQLHDLKIYLDPEQAVAEAFKVRGLPTSVVLDARGREVGKVEGGADWMAPKMLSVLQPLLDGEAEIKRAAR
jgi:thiol-disulfide isomerase/thioredoxin